jgi:septum formation protein
VDETLDAPPSPEAAVRLALRKARAVAPRTGEGIVLAADTLVVVDGASLGKPSDGADARAMLRRLSGRAHRVITGVAVVEARTGAERSAAVVSCVFMRALGAAEIDAYVATGEPRDKAGAYAIQGQGGRLVAALLGSYTNVVGLPLPAVRRLLRWGASNGPPKPPDARAAPAEPERPSNPPDARVAPAEPERPSKPPRSSRPGLPGALLDTPTDD